MHVEICVAIACDGVLPIGILLITSECVGAVNYISKM